MWRASVEADRLQTPRVSDVAAVADLVIPVEGSVPARAWASLGVMPTSWQNR